MVSTRALVLMAVLGAGVAKEDQPKDNDEASATMEELVMHQGLTLESLPVETDDGYVCTMHHIPGQGRHTATQGAILLQHGLLDSSETWCMNDDNSLAFLLARQGYNVFMGNSRGNKYCRQHKTLTVDDNAFWKFSWDEMATHDLTAFVDAALDEAGLDALTMYVGHSQGTTQMFARMVNDHALTAKVPLFVALAPVAYLGHTSSMLISTLATFRIDKLIQYTGLDEFAPSSAVMNWLLPNVCGGDLTSHLCTNVMWLLSGYNPDELNLDRLSVFLSHFPSGTSVQNMGHWAQAARGLTTSDRGDFAGYDWGTAQLNRAKYGRDTPPIYNLSNYPTSNHKLVFFSGGKDALGNTRDVARLFEDLGPECVAVGAGGFRDKPTAVCRARRLEDYDHLDFIWGKNAKQHIYLDILNLANEQAGLPHMEHWGEEDQPTPIFVVWAIAGAVCSLGAITVVTRSVRSRRRSSRVSVSARHPDILLSKD